MKKQKTISQLKKEADRVFSLALRKSYANDFDKVACYTCGKVGDIKEMQCGHYISRSHMETRYAEENCRVQCVGCNVFKNGNMAEFSFRLLKEIGKEGFEALEARKRVIRPFGRKAYEAVINKYKA